MLSAIFFLGAGNISIDSISLIRIIGVYDSNYSSSVFTRLSLSDIGTSNPSISLFGLFIEAFSGFCFNMITLLLCVRTFFYLSLGAVKVFGNIYLFSSFINGVPTLENRDYFVDRFLFFFRFSGLHKI